MDTTINNLAAQISKKGLALPVLLLLEMHKPLYGSLTLVFDALLPIFKPFCKAEQLSKFTEIFKSQESVDLLISELERVR